MQNENNNQPEIKVVGMLDISSHDHSRRVHDPDGLCPTLTAVAGGTHHIKIFDPTKYRVRKLTPTEYGRLQAFPVDDGWEQVVSDSQAYKQFGNAVTKNVVTAIGGAIKDFLDRRPREEHTEEVTDLSDAPNETKEEIIMNAEKLEQREAEKTTATEPATVSEMEIVRQEGGATAILHSFNAVAQLKKLADERKALASINPDSERLKDDIRAIEYAVSVLEAIAI